MTKARNITSQSLYGMTKHNAEYMLPIKLDFIRQWGEWFVVLGGE